MRLLNIKTMQVVSFPNRQISDIPDYAILSHRWGPEEVTFHEMQNKPTGIYDKKGYEKIRKCCEIASSTGFEFIWIDTCCIDKTNKLELTSTLASMFQYYRNSQVCYTYMADVSSSDNPYDAGSDFRTSTWFKRGWTLQELVAPLLVTFFDQDWNEIGTKSSLQTVITEETGIPSQVLLMNHGGEISVAQRMEWAKGRDTAVPEDRAYCMMGLLGVKMPVEYGEGDAASKRLDDEIENLRANASGDLSKFDVVSWMRPEPEYQFFLSIQQRPYRPTHIEYPDVSGPRWTIREEEIRLWFGNSGNCAVLILKDMGGHTFAVCLGVHNYNVWCGITGDYEDNIEKVAKEYWNGHKNLARWNNMDRGAMFLPSGEIASLAIKKGRRDGKRAYFVELHAENYWLDRVGPGVFPGW